MYLDTQDLSSTVPDVLPNSQHCLIIKILLPTAARRSNNSS